MNSSFYTFISFNIHKLIEEELIWTNNIRNNLIKTCNECKRSSTVLSLDESLLPQRPYINVLLKNIAIWGETNRFPEHNWFLEGVQKHDITDIDALTAEFHDIYIMINNNNNDNNTDKLILKLTETLNKLTTRNILVLLGMQSTVGTVDIFPPCVHILIESFILPHQPPLNKEEKEDNSVVELNEYGKPKRTIKPSILTVGARALAKHSHRGKDQFWGIMSGNERKQNDIALQQLYKIFQYGAWFNIHLLTHDLIIYEIRVKEGYGARWLCDGSKFRGFLECYIENGHEQRWRH